MSQKYVTFIAQRCSYAQAYRHGGKVHNFALKECALYCMLPMAYTYLQLCMQFIGSGSLGLCLKNGKCITVK